MIRDLRDFVTECEKIGELERVKAKVDWNLEVSHISDINEERRGPALLFENVRDSKFPLLMAALSSPRRCALALNMPIEYSRLDMAREWMERVTKQRIPPRVVSSGPVMENVIEEKDVDLFKLPIPKFYPIDGGRYIGTTAALITEDPDAHFTNLGVYRLMILDEKNIGCNIQVGKHATRMWHRYGELGYKAMPAAIAVGDAPVLFFFTSTGVPWGISEYEMVGAVQGEPMDIVKSDLTGLLIPGRAEFVLEGEISTDPASFRPEGPFGEYPGYYSGKAGEAFPKQVFKVKRILHRDNAIFWSITVSSYFGAAKNVIPSIQISASIWSELRNMRIPGLKAVYCPPEAGGRFMTVVSIKPQYPGHAVQAGHAVFASTVGQYRTKVCIVVDEDIPPDNMDKVLWAVATRGNAQRSTHVYLRTAGEILDPGMAIEQRDVASKLLIDATIPYEWKEKPILVSHDPKTREAVEKRWKEYGIEIKAPWK
jgi:4-hydroxy-3-polyprenylbenzoate decarboxylase